MHQGLDPRICNIHVDANALDGDGGLRDALVARFLSLVESDEINLVTPASVRREVSHPRTPADVQAAILPRIYTMNVSRTAGEVSKLGEIRKVLRGNATSGKHDADAEHLFEASKYGAYFITEDQRILRKRAELRPIIGPALQIVTLDEFLAQYDRFDRIGPLPAPLTRNRKPVSR